MSFYVYNNLNKCTKYTACTIVESYQYIMVELYCHTTIQITWLYTLIIYAIMHFVQNLDNLFLWYVSDLFNSCIYFSIYL